MLTDQPPRLDPPNRPNSPLEQPAVGQNWTCELDGGFEDNFDDFDEDDFDDEFDDDFEEEVEGEYELQDDEYGAEFNESTADNPSFGDFNDDESDGSSSSGKGDSGKS